MKKVVVSNGFRVRSQIKAGYVDKCKLCKGKCPYYDIEAKEECEGLCNTWYGCNTGASS